MAEIIGVIFGLYLFVALFTWLGLFRRRETSSLETLDSASVVICARNEETDLPACLRSLENQTFSSDSPPQVEVILVNDSSQDGTLRLMEEYKQNSRYAVHVLNMEPPQPGESSGKWRPLKEGLKLANGAGLLLTDADAVLPPGWISGHLRYLHNSAIVAGFARIDRSGIWGGIQALDWLFLLGVGSALNQWGVPQAALGKNLSLRKENYQAVGGLEKIGFSLTEDLSLVQAIVRAGGRLRFPLNPALMVSNPGVETWKEFLDQRMRWASGIKRLRFAGQVCLFIMALRHVIIVLGLLAGSSTALWGWAATAAMNFLILLRLTQKLDLKRRLWAFLLWEVFYTWTAPLLAAFFLSRRRVVWKERKFGSAAYK